MNRLPPVWCFNFRFMFPTHSWCVSLTQWRGIFFGFFTHESIRYPKMNISHWDAAIHYGLQLVRYCDQTRSWNSTLRRSPPVYPLALRRRNTKVPVWNHQSIGYPKMDMNHWDAAINYGIQLAQYCDPTRNFNATFLRSTPVNSLALKLRNTKVPVWTHESTGYPKMNITHWDAAIHYGVQLAQHCDESRSWKSTLRRSPQCTPLPYDSGTPYYLCGVMSP